MSLRDEILALPLEERATAKGEAIAAALSPPVDKGGWTFKDSGRDITVRKVRAIPHGFEVELGISESGTELSLVHHSEGQETAINPLRIINPPISISTSLEDAVLVDVAKIIIVRALRAAMRPDGPVAR